MMLSASDAGALAQAAAQLRAGGLLGLPTETVYGLAADADNPQAVAAIFATKGRPADHPLIVHVAHAGAVAHYAASVPPAAQRLMQTFWPGPLTVILPRRAGVAEAAAGGQPSVGLRCPAHPLARALLQQLWAGQPRVWGLAAPSANAFGRVSPTTAAHVRAEFGEAVPVLDGGPCAVGIESTIVDCTRACPVLLRPGAITPQQMVDLAGVRVVLPGEGDAPQAPAPKASGTLESHYAPRARVRLWARDALLAALAARQEPSAWVAHTSGVSPAGPVGVWADAELLAQLPPHAALHGLPQPQQPQAAAQQLFAALRALDDRGVAQIWVQAPPPGQDWDGVRDRLRRAAH